MKIYEYTSYLRLLYSSYSKSKSFIYIYIYIYLYTLYSNRENWLVQNKKFNLDEW